MKIIFNHFKSMRFWIELVFVPNPWFDKIGVLIVKGSLALFLVVDPVAYKLGTICIEHSSKTISHVLFHAAFVFVPIWIILYSHTLLFTFFPLSIVHAIICPNMTSLPFISTILPVPLIKISTRKHHSSPSLILLPIPLPQIDAALGITCVVPVVTVKALGVRLIIDESMLFMPHFPVRPGQLVEKRLFFKAGEGFIPIQYFYVFKFDNLKSTKIALGHCFPSHQRRVESILKNYIFTLKRNCHVLRLLNSKFQSLDLNFPLLFLLL